MKRNGRVDIIDDRGLTPLDVLGEAANPPSPPPLLDLTPDSLPTSTDYKTIPSREKHNVPGNEINLEMRSRDIGLRPPPVVAVRSVFPPPVPVSVAQKVADELINKGAKLTVCDKHCDGLRSQHQLNTTCLHMAVENQDVQLLEYLLKQGACMHTLNHDGLNALHLAVTKQLIEPLRILLNHGKSNGVNNISWFPFISS